MQLGHDMTKLSRHFTWDEANVTESRTVDNTIPDDIKKNIKIVAAKLDVVRDLLGYPILPSSWYRSPVLNKKVGGSRNSQHMLGEALDFRCPQFGSPLKICKYLEKFKLELDWDQLILEHTWVHISFCSIPTRKPRQQMLSLLNDKSYAVGWTDKNGKRI
jgi:hypothetical protein